MATVFISYRRSDTSSGYASWIYERLAAELGPANVFMDIDSLPLGVDFVEYLENALARTDIALVLIGPGWLHALDEDGTRTARRYLAARSSLRRSALLCAGTHSSFNGTAGKRYKSYLRWSENHPPQNVAMSSSIGPVAGSARYGQAGRWSLP